MTVSHRNTFHLRRPARISLVRATVLAIALIAATVTSPLVARADVGDAASGTGTIEGWPHCPGGSTTTFSFSATGAAGTSASGTFSFTCSATMSFPATSYSGSVSCLNVVGGDAAIGGTITASTQAGFPVGNQFHFDVRDGGPAGDGDGLSNLMTTATCPNPAGGYGALSSGDISVTEAPIATPPSPPTGVSAGAGEGQADVSWLAPDDSGSSPIDYYTVTPSNGAPAVIVDPPVTTTTVPGLTNGQSYAFTVSATNEDGETSSESAPSESVTPSAGAPDPESESDDVAAGGTASTGNDASPGDPTNTTVQTPTGGTVLIGESAMTGTAPAGTYFGQQIDITAPDASAADPLVFTFVYDCSVLPTSLQDCDAPMVEAAAAVAAPATATVAVRDGAYLPSVATVQPGGAVTWQFEGTRRHSVVESGRLGARETPLFNSGNRTPGSTYMYTFVSAGRYAYRSTSTGDRASMAGAVSVPVSISADTASPTDTTTVTWASSRQAGFRFDVQYRYRAANAATYGSWRGWRTNTLMTSGQFTNANEGDYQFRAHLENSGTNRASGWSDPVVLGVTSDGGSDGDHLAGTHVWHQDDAEVNQEVFDCNGAAGVVDPLPACVVRETLQEDGDLVIVVNTTHNGRWRASG
jgi:plastocyanin